jgi:hypothetical protein
MTIAALKSCDLFLRFCLPCGPPRHRAATRRSSGSVGLKYVTVHGREHLVEQAVGGPARKVAQVRTASRARRTARFGSSRLPVICVVSSSSRSWARARGVVAVAGAAACGVRGAGAAAAGCAAATGEVLTAGCMAAASAAAVAGAGGAGCASAANSGSANVSSEHKPSMRFIDQPPPVLPVLRAPPARVWLPDRGQRAV